MWPFTKKLPKDKWFLIHEDDMKRYIQSEIALQLLCEHMEQNNRYDYIITEEWIEAIRAGVGSDEFYKNWNNVIATYAPPKKIPRYIKAYAPKGL